MFAGNTRLPMVAGWDDLLPAWFTKTAFEVSNAGEFNSVCRSGNVIHGDRRPDRRRETGGISILWNASGVFLCADVSRDVRDTDLGLRASGLKVPIWLKLAAISGFAMTDTLHRAFDRPDRQGRESIAFCGEDRRADHCDKLYRCRHLSSSTPKAKEYGLGLVFCTHHGERFHGFVALHLTNDLVDVSCDRFLSS
jgi:hypothetical protein